MGCRSKVVGGEVTLPTSTLNCFVVCSYASNSSPSGLWISDVPSLKRERENKLVTFLYMWSKPWSSEWYHIARFRFRTFKVSSSKMIGACDINHHVLQVEWSGWGSCFKFMHKPYRPSWITTKLQFITAHASLRMSKNLRTSPYYTKSHPHSIHLHLQRNDKNMKYVWSIFWTTVPLRANPQSYHCCLQK